MFRGRSVFFIIFPYSISNGQLYALFKVRWIKAQVLNGGGWLCSSIVVNRFNKTFFQRKARQCTENLCCREAQRHRDMHHYFPDAKLFAKYTSHVVESNFIRA